MHHSQQYNHAWVQYPAATTHLAAMAQHLFQEWPDRSVHVTNIHSQSMRHALITKTHQHPFHNRSECTHAPGSDVPTGGDAMAGLAACASWQLEVLCILHDGTTPLALTNV
jgi:hypothetical protein